MWKREEQAWKNGDKGGIVLISVAGYAQVCVPASFGFSFGLTTG